MTKVISNTQLKKLKNAGKVNPASANALLLVNKNTNDVFSQLLKSVQDVASKTAQILQAENQALASHIKDVSGKEFAAALPAVVISANEMNERTIRLLDGIATKMVELVQNVSDGVPVTSQLNQQMIERMNDIVLNLAKVSRAGSAEINIPEAPKKWRFTITKRDNQGLLLEVEADRIE